MPGDYDHYVEEAITALEKASDEAETSYEQRKVEDAIDDLRQVFNR